MGSYQDPRLVSNRPLSRCGHVESLESKKLCFYTSNLALEFFHARLDVQNVLFLC